MKFMITLLVVLFAYTAIVFAQLRLSPLQSLVETEQAFSKAAEVQGTREAFAAFIADDGILYRPNPVNGKKWMLEHPLPPSTTRPLLAWQPIFAYVSHAGDLGYTTGPWEYKDNIQDAKPSGYGNFVTIWKKQADGSWKFVVDLGISHPMSAGPLTLWHPLNQKSVGSVFKTIPINVDRVRPELTEFERSFSDAVQKQGTEAAFVSYADTDVRLFRADHLPFVGLKAASKALAESKEQLKWEPAAADVSTSGDLGYTYGTYETTAASAKKVKGNYVHIWKRVGNTWKLVLDVTNALP